MFGLKFALRRVSLLRSEARPVSLLSKSSLRSTRTAQSFIKQFSTNSILKESTEKSSKKEYDTSALNNMTREQIRELREIHFSKQRKYNDRTTINYSLSIGILFLGLSYAAVVLYRTLCARTGFGGRPVTDKTKFTNDKLIPVDMDKRIRISFTSEVSDILPWKFVPQQREVHVLPGETALAFYKAKNNSDKDIVGMATYSITPGEASPYFNKIQCFCFEEQRLRAGEEVDMPVFFFIDPDFANDPRMRNIEDLILHYAFFKAHYEKDGNLAPVDATKDIELTPIKVEVL